MTKIVTPEALKPHSNYILQSSHKTYCPSCQKIVDLLCEDLFAASKARRLAKPWFYICWHCKKIFELGKGEVKRVIIVISFIGRVNAK